MPAVTYSRVLDIVGSAWRSAKKAICRLRELRYASLPLRQQSDGQLSAGRRLCRPHSQGRHAGEPSDPPADQVRAAHQHDHCEGDRAEDSGILPAARRRGDRVKRRKFITLLGGAAVVWPLAARAQKPSLIPLHFVRPVTSKVAGSSPVAPAIVFNALVRVS
jgi:hypothetical protein